MKKQQNTIPANAVPSNSNVLAEGENTGHAHRLSGGVFTISDLDDRKFLKVEHPTKVSHEEHAAFDIFEGDYEVRIVREFDHLAEEARAVAD